MQALAENKGKKTEQKGNSGKAWAQTSSAEQQQVLGPESGQAQPDQAAVDVPGTAGELPQHADREASVLGHADVDQAGEPSANGQEAAGDAAASATPLPAPAKRKRQEPTETVPARQEEQPKGKMKERKKEFLKRRKLKKKGRAQAEEEELEAQLLQDPHKPNFGEQAMAPIKVGF